MRLGWVGVIGAAALAGCGTGGTGGTEETVLVVTPPPSLDGADATFFQIRDDFAEKFAWYDDPFPTTSIAQMPVSGSATYIGSAVHSDQTTDPVVVRASPTLTSRVLVTADFDAADVKGSFYHFRSADPAQVVEGGLALNGIIDGNTFRGGVFAAPGGVEGTLVTDGVAVDHSGAFIGNFAGSGLEAITGAVVHSTPTSTYSGVFVADR